MILICLIIILLVVFAFYLYIHKKYQPSHILIIRHADKIIESPGKNSALDNAPLNQKGKARAENYIKELYNYAIQNYGENFKSAYAIKPTPSYSMRPEQTIMPFCFTYNIPLYLPGGITDLFLFDEFKQAINIEENDGKPVLICFEHTCIQNLVSSLGFDFDNYWNNDNYTCGIDIDVKNKSLKIVYFPFEENDDKKYIEYLNTHRYQACK